MHMCAPCVNVCTFECKHPRGPDEKGIGSPRAGVTGSSEPNGLGSGKKTLVLWRSRM